MKIDVLPDSDTVAREAAKFIAAEARAPVLACGRFLFAVRGGRTPWLMLRALAGEPVPWPEMHLVQVDERVAPEGDPEWRYPCSIRHPKSFSEPRQVRFLGVRDGT